MNKILTSIKEASVKKLILILIFFLLCVTIVVLGPKVYSDYRERKKDKRIENEIKESSLKKAKVESEVSEIKKWRIESQISIGAKEIKLETKWQNGFLLYKLEVDLTNSSNQILKNRTSYEGFNIEFLDADSFKLFKIHVPLSRMTGIVDEKGTTVSFSENNKIQISAEEYKKFEEWTIGWDF